MALQTSLGIKIDAKLTKSADLGQSPVDDLIWSHLVELVTGTGAGMADRSFYDERSVAASSSEDLDITGSLADQFGTSLTLARVKLIAIRALPTNVNNVIVGAASATQWVTLLNAAGTVTLRPGAVLLAAAGEADATAYAVTAGTGDLLKVANSGSGTPVLYQVILIGASA